MTFEERFEKISLKFEKADKSALESSFAVQVNITDEDCGGTFYIAYIDGSLCVEPYDYYDHSAMLTSSADDFMKIITGKLNVENGIESGRFSAEGNIDDIKHLATMFPKTVRAPKIAKKAEPVAKIAKTDKKKKK